MEPEEAREFARDHKVDPESLDVECAMQSELYYKWSQKSAEVKLAYDSAKIELDRAQADRELRIRRDPKKYCPKMLKLTESSVKAMVLSSKGVQKAHDNLLEVRGRMLEMDRAEKTMEMKKRMLECLIQLHGQQYFAGPKTPRNLAEAHKKRQEVQEEILHEKQRVLVRKRKARKR